MHGNGVPTFIAAHTMLKVHKKTPKAQKKDYLE